MHTQGGVQLRGKRRVKRCDRGKRLRHAAEDDLGSLTLEHDGHDSAGGLDAHEHALQRPGHRERGAQGGVTGERQLARGREDADAQVAALLGGEDEGALRKVELACEQLHLVVGQAHGVGEHCQLVALKRHAGEHVDE